MEIREEQNLFRLLMGSLQLVNRSANVLLVYLIIVGLVTAGVHYVCPKPISSLLMSLFSTYSAVVLWRILAAKAENNGESISNSFSASILPSVYILFLSILLGIVIAAASLLIVFLHIPKTVFLVLALIIYVFAATRLIFTPFAVAIRNQGPIEAIIYSWNLTGRQYLKVLFAFLLSIIIPPLLILAVVYGIYVGIPLFFANTFNLANHTMPWIVLLVCLGILWFFLIFSLLSFTILLFLNLDYGENRYSFTPNIVKEAEAKKNSFAPSKPEPVNLNTQDVELITEEDMQSLIVTQSSIKTENSHEHLSEHLDQVYQPKAEDFAQYSAEEDRMPTILFDDDMARQIEENRKMMEQQAQPKQQEDKGEDSFSIKMSK